MKYIIFIMNIFYLHCVCGMNIPLLPQMNENLHQQIIRLRMKITFENIWINSAKRKCNSHSMEEHFWFGNSLKNMISHSKIAAQNAPCIYYILIQFYWLEHLLFCGYRFQSGFKWFRLSKCFTEFHFESNNNTRKTVCAFGNQVKTADITKYNKQSLRIISRLIVATQE